MAGLLILALALAGCATSRVFRMYEGPPRPDDQVARLRVPNAIDVYSIDGKVVVDFLFKAGVSEVQMLPGEHEIVARYNMIWLEEPEAYTAVKSDLVGMKFDARAGHRYRIAFPEPKDMDAAVKFADNVKLWVEDLAPASPSDLSAIVPSAKHLGTTAEALGRRGGAPVAAKPENAAAPAPSETVGALFTAPVPASSNAPAAATETLPLQNLKFWWQKADDQDRRQFREWLPTAP